MKITFKIIISEQFKLKCFIFNSENKEPKFAKLVNDSDGIYEYDGLGYNIKIKKITLEDESKLPEKIDMYLFGVHLNGSVLCYNSPEEQTNERVALENLPKLS